MNELIENYKNGVPVIITFDTIGLLKACSAVLVAAIIIILLSKSKTK